MQINFYEEFPTEENLEKLKLIKFPTKIFMAAKSIKGFKKLEKQARKINNKIKVAYWPIIKNSYWISPFSNTEDLSTLFLELKKTKNFLLIDLELPLSKKLVLKNILRLWENKKLIKQFLEKNKNRITTAQHPISMASKTLRFIGLGYSIKNEKSLMFYSSTNSKKINKYVKNILKSIKNKQDYSISLGTIATGILGNEPILSPKNLEKDLDFVKQSGFNKVIIFRLGGLNNEHIKVINKFQK